MTREEVIERLVTAARESSRREFSVECLDKPDWDQATRWLSDWRYYVPDETVEVWEFLPVEARLVAYINASHTADSASMHDDIREWDD